MDTTYDLRARRKALGLTLADVSAKCGVPLPNLSRIERGEQDPRASTLFRILGALELEVRPEQALTLADIERLAAEGQARLSRFGLSSSSPEDRLEVKAARGEDVADERAVLEARRSARS